MIKNDQKSDNVRTGRTTVRSHKIAIRQDSRSEQGAATGTARRAVLTGGALGLAAVAGSTLGGAEPANAAIGGGPIWISPLGGGQDDTSAIQNILNQPGGGILGLSAGTFNITSVTVPAQTTSGTGGGSGWSVIGCGSATAVNVSGTGTGFSLHRQFGYGAQFGLPAQHTTSFMRNFVIDGTNASPGAVGVDVGDGWGYDIDLVIVNFSQPGSIGLRLNNKVFWTEKGRFTAQPMNNDTAAVIDSVGGDISHEYNFFDFNMVHVGGGTVTGITINTVPTTLTSGNFFIPAGASIAVSYTGAPAPTWTRVPAAFSSA
jgi:hypothetical protein